MPRVLKVALLTILAFVGGLFTFAGIRFWTAAHRSVRTVFDPLPADSEGMRMDNMDPWVDKEFIFQRIGAAVILLLGVSILSYLIGLVRQKKLNDSATNETR
jgi:hypothetical protein